MRIVHRLAVAAFVAATAFAVATAGEPPLVEHVDGYPVDFHKGEEASFAVFHKPGAGWHVIVTSAGRRHHFKGRIWIEGTGKFGVVEQWKGEGERRAEAAEHNWFHKAVRRHEN